MNNPYNQCPKCNDLESFWRAEAELLLLEQDSAIMNKDIKPLEQKNDDIPPDARKQTTN